MLQTLRSVSSLVLGATILQIGIGLFGTFLSVRMDLEGFAPLEIGGVGSAYFAGFILGALWIGYPIRSVGHIRAFAALAAVMCCATLLFAILVHPLAWTAFRFLNGFAVSGLFVIVESWLNERAPNESRGQVFALYMIANYTALGGGQFLLTTASVEGSQHFIIAALLCSISLLPVVLTRTSAPAPYSGNRLSLVRLIRLSPLGVAGCVACGLVNSAFYALAPVFVLDIGLDTAWVARFMGAAILAGLVLQWPLGKLSDVFDRRTILVIIAAATTAIAIVIATLGGDQPVYLLILAALYGGTVFTIYPLSVAHANDYIDPSDLVPASAGLLIAYGTGAVVGPLLGAAVMEVWGSIGLFGYIAAISGVLALFGLIRMRMRAPVPNDEQIPFVPVPRTSPVVGELDPRSEVEIDDEDNDDDFEMRFGPDDGDAGDLVDEFS